MADIILNNVEISVSTTSAEHNTYNHKTQRRLHIPMPELSAIPEELFAVKVSQSKNPNKAGKTVFKYLTFKQPGDDQPTQDFAPQGVNIGTPVAEIKQAFMNLMATNPAIQLEFTLHVNLPGKFANIETSEGRFTIFDMEAFPETEGAPGYYIKRGTHADVTLTPAVSQGNQYYQVALKTSQGPDEIFEKSERARVWGQDDDTTNFSDLTGTVPPAPTGQFQNADQLFQG